MPGPRLATRAVIVENDRLLLVNAWPGGKSDLWCAPGGGVERGQSLPETLARELREECGLGIAVGAPCLINEFHDPAGSFHQVEIFFRCTITAGRLCDSWQDPEGVVHQRRFFTRQEVRALRLKPSSLETVAWQAEPAEALLRYDPLEPILR